jgi:hypothetical protein
MRLGIPLASKDAGLCDAAERLGVTVFRPFNAEWQEQADNPGNRILRNRVLPYGRLFVMKGGQTPSNDSI